MWEAYELGNEDYLWTCTAFMGGIGGHQQAPCGAASASAVCPGLRYRYSLAEKERVKQSRLAVRQNAIHKIAMKYYGFRTMARIVNFTHVIDATAR